MLVYQTVGDPVGKLNHAPKERSSKRGKNRVNTGHVNSTPIQSTLKEIHGWLSFIMPLSKEISPHPTRAHPTNPPKEL